MDPIIEQIFENVEGISEDFKAKTVVIFEAAVNEKAKQITEAEVARISAEFDQKHATALTEATEQMTDKVDEFLNTVVTEWATENQIAIDAGIKVELAESFIGGLKDLFTFNQVAVAEPEVKGLVEAAQTEAAEAKQKLEEATVALTEAKSKLQAVEFSAIFEELTKGLADTQRDRVKSLSESLSIADADAYRQKVGILVEALSTGAKVTKETITEATQPSTEVSQPARKTSSLIERTLALKH